MRAISPSPLLRTAFLADAAVSGTAALLQVAAPSALRDALHLPSVLLFESGIFLVAYTALLVVLARTTRLPVAAVGLVIAGNVAWAVACLALLLVPSLAPGALGIAYLLMQAVAVLIFAAWEYAGWHRSEPASPPMRDGGIPDGRAAAGQRAV